MLRDIVRILSDGEKDKKGLNVGLVDERSEIAAMYKGIPQNDVGLRTDVMNNCTKEIGMRMMIRSMGPEIIATDEVGNENDVETIMEACCAGIKLLLTAHGGEIEDIPKKLKEKQVFKNVVVLKNENHPGEIKKIYRLENNKYVDIC